MFGQRNPLSVVGVVLVALGGLLLVLAWVPGLGRLPGDIVIRRGNFTIYLPITTSLILSVLVTLVLFVIGRAR